MKLRLKNNSVRLRLTQTEVRRFAETGRVEERIEFGLAPRERFVYALAADAENDRIRAAFETNKIIVFIPKKQAEEWARGERIGMEIEQDTGGGKSLRILIEKDFACLESREGEDESDAFPHPSQERIC